MSELPGLTRLRVGAPLRGGAADRCGRADGLLEPHALAVNAGGSVYTASVPSHLRGAQRTPVPHAQASLKRFSRVRRAATELPPADVGTILDDPAMPPDALRLIEEGVRGLGRRGIATQAPDDCPELKLYIGYQVDNGLWGASMMGDDTDVFGNFFADDSEYGGRDVDETYFVRATLTAFGRRQPIRPTDEADLRASFVATMSTLQLSATAQTVSVRGDFDSHSETDWHAGAWDGCWSISVSGNFGFPTPAFPLGDATYALKERQRHVDVFETALETGMRAMVDDFLRRTDRALTFEAIDVNPPRPSFDFFRGNMFTYTDSTDLEVNGTKVKLRLCPLRRGEAGFLGRTVARVLHTAA